MRTWQYTETAIVHWSPVALRSLYAIQRGGRKRTAQDRSEETDSSGPQWLHQHPPERLQYLTVNPNFKKHPMYAKGSICPEYARIAATHIPVRLSSHSLRVETGRCARIPRHLRSCSCGSGDVQDELHVLLYCPLSQSWRESLYRYWISAPHFTRYSV